MKRRNFITKGALSGSFVALGGASSTFAQKFDQKYAAHNFNLKYAPHLGMFQQSAGENLIDQLHYMADQGFKAFEDNEMCNRPVKSQREIAGVMKQRELEMGVFVAHKIYWDQPNLTSGKQDYRDEFLNDIKNSIEVAKRVNAKYMTVVPGYLDQRLNLDYQTAHVIESLKQAAALLEDHDLTMVLEPLNFFNHPGMFLKESPQAYKICKAVDSPSCKILFDIYHQQIQEGNLIPNINASWDEIAYFQVGDNPGRNEPGTGEINYKNVFKLLAEKAYDGIVGMEHGNSQSGKAGEQAVIAAYKQVDNF